MIWTFLSLPLALGLAPLVRRLALSTSLVDRPRADRFHSAPTPKLGGVVVLAAALPAMVVWWPGDGVARAFLSGLGVTFLVGLLDDLRSLPPRTKLVGQIVAAAASASWLMFGAPGEMAVGWLVGVPPAVLCLGAIIWIVAFQNAVNFIDNMDGIAAGISAIALIALAAHLAAGADRALALALALGAVGFLPYNTVRPARLFLGDAGSLPLGHAVAFFSLDLALRAPTAGVSVAAIVVVMIPILDITFVTITRIREGRSPAVGGKDHTTHRLFARTGSVTVTQLAYWAAGIILAAASIPISALGSGGALASLLGVGALFAGVGWLFSRMPTPDAARD